MSDVHDPFLREGHRGNAILGLDWLLLSGSISEESALRIAGLCFLGPPVDHGDGPASYRRRPEIERRTRRRTLVVQRHGEGGLDVTTPPVATIGTSSPPVQTSDNSYYDHVSKNGTVGMVVPMAGPSPVVG